MDGGAQRVPGARGSWWLAGVLTGLAGLAAGWLTCAVMQLPVNPISAIAEVIRDLTPGPIALFLIHLVGKADKPLLTGGIVVGFVLLSALAGRLARRRLLWGRLIFVALAVAGGAALASRDGIGRNGIVPALVAGLVWVGVLGVLRGDLRTQDLVANRRSFLIHGGVVLGATATVGVLARVLGRDRVRVEEARALLRLPAGRGTQPRGAGLGVDGVARWRTPNSTFYRIDTAFAVPTLAPEKWELRIHGMVERELTLTYAELLAREMTGAWVTLACVSNEVGGDLIGNAYWTGVPVRLLLEEAGVKPGADAVRQVSADGWDCGTPLTALTDDRNALLAVAMNGKPLPLEHGFPVRTVVPGLYGYVSATKWVTELEVTRFADFEAYWTQRGWAARGPIKTQSRIDVPRPSATVPAGNLDFGGVAWAQHRGIERVEWQLDGGRWTEAMLGEGVDDDTWVQWSGSAEVAPGEHTLVVRATDKNGATQTEVRVDVVPDGATGWHQVDFTAE